MKEIDCRTVYAHTFIEIENEMTYAPRGARMTVHITEQGNGYALKAGDEVCYQKKNMRLSPFHKDAGTWVDGQGYDQDGLRVVRDFLIGLHRCDFKFIVRIV